VESWRSRTVRLVTRQSSVTSYFRWQFFLRELYLRLIPHFNKEQSHKLKQIKDKTTLYIRCQILQVSSPSSHYHGAYQHQRFVVRPNNSGGIRPVFPQNSWILQRLHSRLHTNSKCPHGCNTTTTQLWPLLLVIGNRFTSWVAQTSFHIDMWSEETWFRWSMRCIPCKCV
jgi:hypothetical protein